MNRTANKTWTADELLTLGRSYQAAAIIAAAADLDLFDALAGGALVPRELAHALRCDLRGQVIRAVQPMRFNHLLDVGGASGTWTMAFLRACPMGHATLFDLPHVIPMARRRFTAAGLNRCVKLIAGDFMADALPRGADLVWVSAIVHQNSRAQNRALFGNVFQALTRGGRIAIRDLLMEPSRTRPVAGALFAVNMLVATPGGGTFTFDELREDLESAGFTQATVVRQDEAMNSIVLAKRPNRN